MRVDGDAVHGATHMRVDGDAEVDRTSPRWLTAAAPAARSFGSARRRFLNLLVAVSPQERERERNLKYCCCKTNNTAGCIHYLKFSLCWHPHDNKLHLF